MSPDPSRHFGCEVYLYAFAAGARDGLVRQHIDACFFCRDIVHGGTEEFPLSYAEEVAHCRAELRRSGRRRFIKIAAACVVGVAMVGATGVLATRNRKPIDKYLHKQKTSLDATYASSGRLGIASLLSTASSFERRQVFAWIGDRGHVALIDLLVGGLDNAEVDCRVAATRQLLKFNPTQLSPWKAQIAFARDQEQVESLKDKLTALAAQIP